MSRWVVDFVMGHLLYLFNKTRIKLAYLRPQNVARTTGSILPAQVADNAYPKSSLNSAGRPLHAPGEPTVVVTETSRSTIGAFSGGVAVLQT